ncbi:small ribosomal subunit biogenesis GTPase RsgA [Candidatus Enterovibrio escicola]|uniref:small ribosomal subunit biogenesis GTPase RsgA n=1 Tax=Candidatus Enterovibrio escicola TaxID=1927127 RepID=UPI000BE305E0|nr:small ribosomal subunit biogenesis GTPase RsgA [Candidatus Enterovibrio escacola]
MAKKKKLSRSQLYSIRINKKKGIDRQQKDIQWEASLLPTPHEGVVITRFGQHADIEDIQTGLIYTCKIHRSIKSLVTGDVVVWRPSTKTLQGIVGVVEAVYERRSVLSRPNYYNGVKPVAANIDQVVIVSAILPKLSTSIIDRYLIATEQVDFKLLIVVNKVDLLDVRSLKLVTNTLSIYRDIGYDVLMVSQRSGEGIIELEQRLSEVTSIFVGQSGVGKSSLVNTLLPDVHIATSEVSENSGLGQHTTTTIRLYHFPNGGDLIDSPGVREFGLWHLEPDQVTQGFIEFHDYIGGCKFRDCKHGSDLGCIIRAAVEKGKISKTRYLSYHKIIESISEMKANRQFSRNKVN